MATNQQPDILDEKQKKNMIKNMISELRMEGKIFNNGTDKNSEWKLKI